MTQSSFVPLPVQLFPLLQWDRHEELSVLCQERRRKHLAFVAGLLASLRRSPGGRIEQLLSSLSELPDESVARILGAPQVCHALCTYDDSKRDALISFLDEILLAERMRATPEMPNLGDAWTALADMHFEAGREGASQHATLVHDSFIVDLDSPYYGLPLVKSNFRPSFGPAVPFSSDQRALVIRRITLAADALQIICPAAYDLSTAMIRTLMPRIDLLNPTYKGSSNRGMIGRVNLFNPHLDNINHAVIASSLVHEAIHILLYLFEQEAPLVEDEFQAQQVRITSPWSGKRVHLLAIVHATFVWYGLLQLWRRPGVEDYFPPREIAYYRRFCANGLRDGRLSAALEKHMALVCPGVLDQLLEMEATARVDQDDLMTEGT